MQRKIVFSGGGRMVAVNQPEKNVMNVISYFIVGSFAGALLFGLAVRFCNAQVSSAVEALFDSIEHALAEREQRRLQYSDETVSEHPAVSLINASSASV